MGSEAVKAINNAEDLRLAATVGSADPMEKMLDGDASVIVDLTTPEASKRHVQFAIEHGLHAVVGTSGWDEMALVPVRKQLEDHPDVGVLIAPNFALGSVLASAFAAKAARYFESAEIVELHHPNKLDAPSGTAVRTAELIAAERRRAGLNQSPDATLHELPGARGADVQGVRVHAVRSRGLVAHQEVIFGAEGEQLTIRHDSFDRASFMPGVLLGIRNVVNRPGLTYGLDGYLDLD